MVNDKVKMVTTKIFFCRTFWMIKTAGTLSLHCTPACHDNVTIHTWERPQEKITHDYYVSTIVASCIVNTDVELTPKTPRKGHGHPIFNVLC